MISNKHIPPPFLKARMGNYLARLTMRAGYLVLLPCDMSFNLGPVSNSTLAGCLSLRGFLNFSSQNSLKGIRQRKL